MCLYVCRRGGGEGGGREGGEGGERGGKEDRRKRGGGGEEMEGEVGGEKRRERNVWFNVFLLFLLIGILDFSLFGVPLVGHKTPLPPR